MSSWSDEPQPTSDVDGRIDDVAAATAAEIISSSADRPAMAVAYAALNGFVSGDLGRQAFRRALVADGMDEETIDHLDALYTRNLLDPSLSF